jgi:hypothetical protein
MKQRDLRRVAAPFVLVASAGCTKPGETITPVPATTTSASTKTASADTPVATTTATATPDTNDLVYDGYGGCYRVVGGEKKYVPQCPESMLPAAPTDQLVYQHGGQCKRVPDGNPVRCPASGPTVILPEPSSIKTATGSVSLQYGSLKCLQYVDVDCPPEVNCNPPKPDVVPCPASLMPKLAAGVKPTKKDQQHCWFGAAEVACPKP